MNQLSARDKLTDEEIVARRAEVFKMACAEATGRIPAVFFGHGNDFNWEAVADPRMEYRACVLADMAYPLRPNGPVCLPCWEHYSYDGVRASLTCDRVSNHDALRFRSCRTAEARAAASHG